MKLKTIKRAAERKCEAKKLRREGSIPAVIYLRGKEAEAASIDSTEFSTLMRTIQPGRLSTQVFTLVGENGQSRTAIIKEIQYNIINYNVIHLDFEELKDDQPVNVKVPIECVGMAESPGVKGGGVLRQVIRYLRVRCLPKDIPASFVMDVKTLGPRESRRLKDLNISEGVRPLANLNEVAAVIVKR